MLTQGFYSYLSSCFKRENGDSFYIALGGGEVSWDTGLPLYQPGAVKLNHEMVRKEVDPKNICFLDEKGEITKDVTPMLSISANFVAGEGVGAVRECGLFGGDAGPDANSGTLLSYFIHPAIEKNANMSLKRSISLDLRPKPIGGDQAVMRFMGNSKSSELHDLDHLTPQCQLDETRPDRRVYFASPEQAIAMGYDYCAFCFGREMSQR